MASSGGDDLSLGAIFSELRKSYTSTTPKQAKILDVFLIYVLLTGVIQFVYCCIVGTFPFNSFLSGFGCTVGVFVLTSNPAHTLPTLRPAQPGRARSRRPFRPCRARVKILTLTLTRTPLPGVAAAPRSVPAAPSHQRPRVCQSIMVSGPFGSANPPQPACLRNRGPATTRRPASILRQAYADYIFCCILLFAVVMNFMG